MPRSTPAEAACPCGRGRGYAACCGPLHQGAPAADPEALMRSRYAAFVLGLDDYLLRTWHPSTRPERLDDADRTRTRWLELEVRRASTVTRAPNGAEHARVEFVARYRIDGRGHRLHEDSAFVREDGRWFYVDGVITR